MTPFIRLHPADDVLIARSQLVGGTQAENVAIKGLIPPGHKVATRDIAPGEPVRRYNQIIGFASKPIAAGEHVHTHNLDMGPTRATSSATTPSAPTSSPSAARARPPSWASSAPTAASPRATTSASCPA